MRLLLLSLLASGFSAAVAQEPGGLELPRADCPVVEDALIGTWRLYDLEENAFEPTGSMDIEITPGAFSMSGERILPNSEEDSWVYIAEGVIGENTDIYFFQVFFYSYYEDADMLVIADFPAPAPDMPGAAVLMRVVQPVQ